MENQGDGPLTGGCIAGGRLYFHINHRGDVEPCIFCHFATHNINECSVAEALASPFFRSII
jgi:MoaA/NifB/PqqE/SkfB family radical SAM enzyme